jgi:hypothetical protein
MELMLGKTGNKWLGVRIPMIIFIVLLPTDVFGNQWLSHEDLKLLCFSFGGCWLLIIRSLWAGVSRLV